MELATGRFGNLLKLELVNRFEDSKVFGCFRMTNETAMISVPKRQTELRTERGRPVLGIFVVVLHELIGPKSVRGTLGFGERIRDWAS